jgi:hypothetical protein
MAEKRGIEPRQDLRPVRFSKPLPYHSAISPCLDLTGRFELPTLGLGCPRSSTELRQGY